MNKKNKLPKQWKLISLAHSVFLGILIYAFYILRGSMSLRLECHNAVLMFIKICSPRHFTKIKLKGLAKYG